MSGSQDTRELLARASDAAITADRRKLHHVADALRALCDVVEAQPTYEQVGYIGTKKGRMGRLWNDATRGEGDVPVFVRVDSPKAAE